MKRKTVERRKKKRYDSGREYIQSDFTEMTT